VNDQQSNTRASIIRVAKIVLVLVILGFVAWVIGRDLSKVDDWSKVRPNWWWVLLSAAMTFSSGLCVLVSYRTLVFAYGGRPSWRQMCAIAWIPAVGKYLPLRIWALMGAVMMLRQIGIPAAVAVGVVLMMDAFSVAMGLLIATPLLAHPLVQAKFPGMAVVAIVAALIGLVVLHPRISGSLVNVALRAMKKPPLERLPTIGQCLPSIFSAFLQWVCAGLALFAMLRAFTPIDASNIPVLCAIAAGASTLGYLSLIAPAGAGVREALLIFSMKLFLPDIPDYVVAVCVVMLRLQQTLIEVAQALIGLWLKRSTSRGETSTLNPASPQ